MAKSWLSLVAPNSHFGMDLWMDTAGLADAEVFGHFQRCSADPADDSRAVAAGEGIVYFARAVGAVEQGMLLAIRWLFGNLSHTIPRL